MAYIRLLAQGPLPQISRIGPRSKEDTGCTYRELNAVDEALWQHGKLLHAKQLQEHKQEGRLASVMAGMQQPSLCMWCRGLLHSPPEFLVW